MLIVVLPASGLVSHDALLVWVAGCMGGLQYCLLGHSVGPLGLLLRYLYCLSCLTFQFRNLSYLTFWVKGYF